MNENSKDIKHVRITLSRLYIYIYDINTNTTSIGIPIQWNMNHIIVSPMGFPIVVIHFLYCVFRCDHIHRVRSIQGKFDKPSADNDEQLNQYSFHRPLLMLVGMLNVKSLGVLHFIWPTYDTVYDIMVSQLSMAVPIMGNVGRMRPTSPARTWNQSSWYTYQPTRLH